MAMYIKLLSLTIIVSVLIGLDLLIRQEYLAAFGVEYAWVIVIVSLSLLSLRIAILAFGSMFYRYLMASIFSVLISLVYFLQYGFYNIYGRFMEPMDVGVFFGNFGYWIKNSNNLLSIEDLGLWFGYLILLLTYFSGLLEFILYKVSEYLRNHSLFRPAGSWVKKTSILVLSLKPIKYLVISTILILGVYGSLTVVAKYAYTDMLTPFFAGKLMLEDFVRNYEDYKIDHTYPVRNVDPMQTMTPRGNFNVLFILQESVNIGHESLYGYYRNTNEWQKEFLEDAYKFEYAISTSTTTRKSCTSIFTGLDHTNGDAAIEKTSLLWQYTKAAGLHNFYITSHWLKWHGMDTGFVDPDNIDYISEPLSANASIGRDDYVTTDIFVDHLKKIAESKTPFFGVLHYTASHYPYWVPENKRLWHPVRTKGYSSAPTEIEKTINQYDNSLYYNDGATGFALLQLRELGLSENTIVILTADHGEALYEHGRWNHGPIFWQEGIHVPFLVLIPEELKKHFSEFELANIQDNIDKYISNVDIFPTILDMLGVPPAKNLSGYSLLKPYPSTFLYSLYDFSKYAAIYSTSGDKFIVDNHANTITYYKLNSDPEEQLPRVIPNKTYLKKDGFVKFAKDFLEAENK